MYFKKIHIFSLTNGMIPITYQRNQRHYNYKIKIIINHDSLRSVDKYLYHLVNKIHFIIFVYKTISFKKITMTTFINSLKVNI